MKQVAPEEITNGESELRLELIAAEMEVLKNKKYRLTPYILTDPISQLGW